MKFNKIVSFLLSVLLLLVANDVAAQKKLDRHIDMRVRQQKLGDVLALISKDNDFYFSYSSRYLPADSLVDVFADNISIRDILDKLLCFNFEYKETDAYIILRPSPHRLSLITEDVPVYKKRAVISGYVIDEQTGKPLNNASVYDKRLLIATLTDRKGHFKLKIPDGQNIAALTVSKEFYRDTSLNILLHPVLVSLASKDGSFGYGPVEDSENVERSAFGRMLISSKQRILSINLGSFFANTPVQASFIPGISTQGLMSSQVVSKLSMNILGGYTNGLSGLEMAGIFNINRKDVEYVQLAGVFNIVGGQARGVQLAGVHNYVMDSLSGFQAGGVYNYIKRYGYGVQLAGVANLTGLGFDGFQIAGVLNWNKAFHGTQISGILNRNRTFKGMQLAGIANNSETFKGTQIAGIANVNTFETRGFQIALFNYNQHFSGMQIGLVNFAQKNSGISLGLLNISKNGYYKLSFYSSEVLNSNISLKTGNSRFYSILTAGLDMGANPKEYGLGFGFGHDFLFKPGRSLSVQFLSQEINSDDWEEWASVSTASAIFNLKLSSILSITAGPSLNIFWNAENPAEGGRSFVPSGLPKVNFNNKAKGWLGYQFGIMLF